MISKIIHNIWIQGHNNLSENGKKNIDIIRKNNPNYIYYFWDDIQIIKLLSDYPKIKNIYINIDKMNDYINIYSIKSDIALYIIMKTYGY